MLLRANYPSEGLTQGICLKGKVDDEDKSALPPHDSGLSLKRWSGSLKSRSHLCSQEPSRKARPEHTGNFYRLKYNNVQTAPSEATYIFINFEYNQLIQTRALGLVSGQLAA